MAYMIVILAETVSRPETQFLKFSKLIVAGVTILFVYLLVFFSSKCKVYNVIIWVG